MDSNVVHQDSNQKVPFLAKYSSLFSDRHFTLCASNDFAELNIAVIYQFTKHFMYIFIKYSLNILYQLNYSEFKNHIHYLLMEFHLFCRF